MQLSEAPRSKRRFNREAIRLRSKRARPLHVVVGGSRRSAQQGANGLIYTTSVSTRIRVSASETGDTRGTSGPRARMKQSTTTGFHVRSP